MLNRPDPHNDIRRRLHERLEARGWSARQLAQLTGDLPANVQRWVYGHVKTIPADFVARCEAVGLGDAGWLLTGEGARDVDGVDVERQLDAFREVREAVERYQRLTGASGGQADVDAVDAAFPPGDGGTQGEQASGDQ